MIRNLLSSKIENALVRLHANGQIPVAACGAFEVAEPRDPQHGDYASNVALIGAKVNGTNPRALAEMLANELRADEDFTAIEIAGPGFLNFRLKPERIAACVAEVLANPDQLSHLTHPNPQRINVEFVSVNPNGPITIGSGRGAAYGSALCNVLDAAGHTVHREYYINDGVNSEQMRLFAASVEALMAGQPVPDDGYKGDYVEDVARAIAAMPNPPADLRRASEQIMIEAQREALTAFGVEFDTWFSEQSLHDSGAVAVEIDRLENAGVADTNPERTVLKLAKGGAIAEVQTEAQDEGGTLWLRSTRFGDDMDRVLRRKDGRLTYISSDIAYHWDKFNRPANGTKLITVLGPDHHGYIGRLHAVLAAILLAVGQVTEIMEGKPLTEAELQLFGDAGTRDRCRAALKLAQERLDVQIYQLVRFLKDGQPAPMRKRDGNIYALIDLMREIGSLARPDGSEAEQLEVGKDVARFFYLMRSHDTTFDFDLDLAAKQSDENPVFYVQYAHARIAGVIRKAEESGLSAHPASAHLLTHEKELALIKRLLDLPYEIERAAQDYGVHRLATFCIELSRSYHAFYDQCRVIQPDQRELSEARLALCRCTQIALQNALRILGISAPERM